MCDPCVSVRYSSYNWVFVINTDLIYSHYTCFLISISLYRSLISFITWLACIWDLENFQKAHLGSWQFPTPLFPFTRNLPVLDNHYSYKKPHWPSIQFHNNKFFWGLSIFLFGAGVIPTSLVREYIYWNSSVRFLSTTKVNYS